MKRIVLTFGLISGAIVSIMMMATLPFVDEHGSSAMMLGYTTMVLAFLLVGFGIRSYRDNVGRGKISFGRAFSVGILITLITCACYVATWEVMYYKFMPDFADKYAASMIDRAKKAGKTQQEIDATAAEMREFQVKYKQPAYNVAMTFIEIFPVGLVITLVSAGVLSRRRASPAPIPLAT